MNPSIYTNPTPSDQVDDGPQLETEPRSWGTILTGLAMVASGLCLVAEGFSPSSTPGTSTFRSFIDGGLKAIKP